MPTGVQYGDTLTRSVRIESNLSGKEYYLVNIEQDSGEESKVAIASGATKFPFVLCEGFDGSSTAKTGLIAVGGRVKVKVGGTVTADDKLTSDGSGLAITTTTGTNHYGLIALQDGSANDVIEALVSFGMVAG